MIEEHHPPRLVQRQSRALVWFERAVFDRAADDRLHTGQRDWHLATRWPLATDVHVALDLLRKTGEGDGGPVQGWGWSATLDFTVWFLRLAHDPKQNFSTQDATRFVAGVRF